MPQRIIFFPYNSCMTSSLTGAQDILQTANHIYQQTQGCHDDPSRQLFELHHYSVDGRAVALPNGLQLAVDGDFSALRQGDVAYIPSARVPSAKELPAFLTQQKSLIARLARAEHKFDRIVSHCSGSFILAQAGLLEGREACTSWWLAEQMAANYSAINVNSQASVVQDQSLITGGASFAFQDVCLTLVQHYGGKPLARLVAKYLLLDKQRSSQAPYAILSAAETDNTVVRAAMAWMRARMHSEFRLEELAQALEVSTRTLTRHFKKSLQQSPQACLQKMRVEKSKVLLETTALDFTDIVARCGYRDESAFRRLFSRYCAITPGEYRQRFSASGSNARSD